MSTENAVTGDSAGSLAPVEGDVGIPSVAQARTRSVSWKGILAVALFVVSLAIAAVFSINRALVSHRKDDDPAAKATGERPIAATAEPRRLDMTPPPAPPKAAASAPSQAFAIPAIVPTLDDAMPEPIGVHRTGQGLARATDAQHVSPEDAPVVLVSSRPGAIATSQGTASRAEQSSAQADASSNDDSLEATKRNLEGYQRQLQTLLETLPKASAGLGPALSSGTMPMSGIHLPSASAAPGAGAGAALFGGQLQGSATPRVVAGWPRPARHIA